MDRNFNAWPCIGAAIREARQDVSDAEWNGGNVQAAHARLDALKMEQRNGVLYVVPF